MPPENEDKGLNIEALVASAVEKASATRAATAATEAVTAKTPEIVAEAARSAAETTKAVVAEVARGLKADFDEKIEAVEAAAKAARGTFAMVSGKTNEIPFENEPGILGARITRAWLCAGEDMNGVPRVLADIYKDKGTADYVARTLETSVPTKGGILVVPQVAVEQFIERLAQTAVLYPLCQQIPMPSGALRIPGYASGPNMGWVGETTKNRASSATFKGINMSSKKAFVMVPISNDLLEEASIDADRILANEIVRLLAELVDNQLINGTKSEHAPGGILTNADITNTSLAAAVDSDLPAEILARVMDRHVNLEEGTVGWLFNNQIWAALFNLKTTTGAYLFREEMNRGMLLGFPYKRTSYIANAATTNNPTKIIFGKFSEILIGVNRELRLERSREAAYYDEDGNVQAAFPRDLTLLMGTFKMDAGFRQPEAIDVTTNVHTS